MLKLIYHLAIVFSILFIFVIILLVRNNKLEEKYSILWFIFSIIILILSIFPQIINFFAKLFGVYYAPSLLFLIGFVVLTIYIIHLSIVITRQNKMLVKLVQEVALIKDKMGENDNIKK